MGQEFWIDPERIFEKVVVLTDDVIYVANPKAGQLAEIQAALESDQPASRVLKDDVETILLGSISKVSFNRNDHDIDIQHKPGKEKEDKNIAFSGPEERDDFAAQLAERLADFDSKTVEWSVARAALGPIGFGMFAAGLTWLLHAAALAMAAGDEAEISGRRSAVKRLVAWTIELVGPTGVLVIGGIVLTLTAFALVARIKTPPIMTTLKKKR